MIPRHLSAEDLNGIVSSAVAAYANRVWWARKPDVQEDLRQQAWMTLFECGQEARWSPQVGVPFSAYAYRAIILALRPVLWMISSPVSAPRNKLKELAEHHHAPITAAEDMVAWHQSGMVPSWADEIIDDAAWHARAKAALGRIADEDPQLALGVDSLVADEKASEYAARTGVDVERVYRAATKARKRIFDDLDLYRLHEEKDE